MTRALNFLVGTLVVVVMIVLARVIASPRNDAHASSPPMGWSSWSTFACSDDYNETNVREIVDAMVTNGLRDKGWEYVLLDDCWTTQDDATRSPGKALAADPKRFPSGIAHLVKYIHSHHMKVGLLLGVGKQACHGGDGSYNFEDGDAASIASWGVDMIKLDGCFIPPQNLQGDFTRFTKIIRDKTTQVGQHPIISCTWPAVAMKHPPYNKNPKLLHWDNIRSACDTWRIADDTKGTWTSLYNTAGQWFTQPDLYRNLTYDQKFVDLGELQIFPHEAEAITQLSMWVFVRSPLFIGYDPRHLNSNTLKLLKNKDILAIARDTSPPGYELPTNNDIGAATRTLSNGRMLISIANHINKEVLPIITWPKHQELAIYDILEQKDKGKAKGRYTPSRSIPPHGSIDLTFRALSEDEKLDQKTFKVTTVHHKQLNSDVKAQK